MRCCKVAAVISQPYYYTVPQMIHHLIMVTGHYINSHHIVYRPIMVHSPTTAATSANSCHHAAMHSHLLPRACFQKAGQIVDKHIRFKHTIITYTAAASQSSTCTAMASRRWALTTTDYILVVGTSIHPSIHPCISPFMSYLAPMPYWAFTLDTYWHTHT
jgi:hypothetical protein